MRGSNPTVEAVPTLGNASIRFLWLAPALIALAVFVATLFTLDPAGDRPSLPEGPGLTTDEVLNVEAGLVLWRDLRSYGWGLLDPTSWYEAYSSPGYQADYPPLGRLILAAGHDCMQVVWPVTIDPSLPARPYFTVQARAASALAFALTVFLVGWYATRWYGRFAGTCASLALVLMPRLFAHAHLASVESIVNFFFTWTVLATADRWPRAMSEWASSPRTRSRWSIPWQPVVITGVLLGLTLLTKIQAVLFPIPFSIWAVWRFGRRGIVAVAAVGIISASVLFVGWPWLWIDPLGHAQKYFGQTTERVVLYCWYLGQRFEDRHVPWHYPFVMFVVTVPVGLHVLGLWGVFTRTTDVLVRREYDGQRRPSYMDTLKELILTNALSDPRQQLILAVMLFPLVLFAVPGVTVYDGERLFLVSFPLWAVCIGRGASSVFAREKLSACRLPTYDSPIGLRLGKSLALLVTFLLLSESYTLITLHPCQLSYSSWLVGGMRGARVLGFEPTYWGDSITRTMHHQIVEHVPVGATVHVAPVLHGMQLPGMLLQSPILQLHQIRLDSYDDRIRNQVKYVLVFRRMADSRTSLAEPADPVQHAPAGMRFLTEIRREGVQLAVLYEVTGL